MHDMGDESNGLALAVPVGTGEKNEGADIALHGPEAGREDTDTNGSLFVRIEKMGLPPPPQLGVDTDLDEDPAHAAGEETDEKTEGEFAEDPGPEETKGTENILARFYEESTEGEVGSLRDERVDESLFVRIEKMGLPPPPQLGVDTDLDEDPAHAAGEETGEKADGKFSGDPGPEETKGTENILARFYEESTEGEVGLLRDERVDESLFVWIEKMGLPPPPQLGVDTDLDEDPAHTAGEETGEKADGKFSGDPGPEETTGTENILASFYEGSLQGDLFDYAEEKFDEERYAFETSSFEADEIYGRLKKDFETAGAILDLAIEEDSVKGVDIKQGKSERRNDEPWGFYLTCLALCTMHT